MEADSGNSGGEKQPLSRGEPTQPGLGRRVNNAIRRSRRRVRHRAASPSSLTERGMKRMREERGEGERRGERKGRSGAERVSAQSGALFLFLFLFPGASNRDPMTASLVEAAGMAQPGAHQRAWRRLLLGEPGSGAARVPREAAGKRGRARTRRGPSLVAEP